MFSTQSLINLVLYALFGVILAESGVSVVDKPIEFLSLLGILMVVDLLSYKNGYNRGVQ